LITTNAIEMGLFEIVFFAIQYAERFQVNILKLQAKSNSLGGKGRKKQFDK